MSFKMSLIKGLAVPVLLISSAAFADVPLQVSSNTVTNGSVTLSWNTGGINGTYYPEVSLTAYSSAEHKSESLLLGSSDNVDPLYIDYRDVKTTVTYTLNTCRYESNPNWGRPGEDPIIYICRSSTQVVKFE